MAGLLAGSLDSEVGAAWWQPPRSAYSASAYEQSEEELPWLDELPPGLFGPGGLQADWSGGALSSRYNSGHLQGPWPQFVQPDWQEIQRRLTATPVANAAQVRKVFVGGVPQDMVEDELEKIFSEYGTIQKAWLQCYRGSGGEPPPHNHRGFGFIIFEHLSSIDRLLGRDFSRYVSLPDGRRLEVKRAVSSKEMISATACLPGAAVAGRGGYGSFGLYDPQLAAAMWQDALMSQSSWQSWLGAGPFAPSQWASYADQAGLADDATPWLQGLEQAARSRLAAGRRPQPHDS